MEQLLDRIARFQTEIFPQSKHLYEELAAGQAPEVLFIGCSDSRVSDQFLQMSPGELFVCRNPGNVVPPHGDQSCGVSATVEYAVELLKVKHLVVCGHSDCGAVQATLDPSRVSELRAVSSWIRHLERAVAVGREMLGPGADRQALVERVIEENVVAQLDNLMTHPSVAAKVRTGALDLHGLVFDIPTGEFKLLDRQTSRFSPLAPLLQARRDQAT